MGYAKKIKMVEVGPRDGLQNEPGTVTTAAKIELIDRLGAAGVTAIEVGSFVSPKRVPQMADTSEVVAGISRLDGVRYTALTPNMQGFEAAMTAGVNEVAVFAAATEAFSQKNINKTAPQVKIFAVSGRYKADFTSQNKRRNDFFAVSGHYKRDFS